MRTTIAAAALFFLTIPAWAQDAAHAQHHPQVPSPPATSSDKIPAETAPGRMGMKKGMMDHCKTMQEQKSGDAKPLDKNAGRSADCAMMHQKMHNS
jgi:hypothetical protein